MRTIRGCLAAWARGLLGVRRFPTLERQIVELNDSAELMRIFGWKSEAHLPVLPAEYSSVEDVNDRRRLDAESLALTAANVAPAICLDIGTALGASAALMAQNAPDAKIYTVNVPPEEFAAAGTHTTICLSREQIGREYRELGLKNIEQIFANTRDWTPELENIDLAYIDACHDKGFVINDTQKIRSKMRPGGFILWHDFNPALALRFPWIFSVCDAIDELLAANIVQGPIFHVRDSWTGLCRVPETGGDS